MCTRLKKDKDPVTVAVGSQMLGEVMSFTLARREADGIIRPTEVLRSAQGATRLQGGPNDGKNFLDSLKDSSPQSVLLGLSIDAANRAAKREQEMLSVLHQISDDVASLKTATLNMQATAAADAEDARASRATIAASVGSEPPAASSVPSSPTTWKSLDEALMFSTAAEHVAPLRHKRKNLRELLRKVPLSDLAKADIIEEAISSVDNLPDEWFIGPLISVPRRFAANTIVDYLDETSRSLGCNNPELTTVVELQAAMKGVLASLQDGSTSLEAVRRRERELVPLCVTALLLSLVYHRQRAKQALAWQAYPVNFHLWHSPDSFLFWCRAVGAVKEASPLPSPVHTAASSRRENLPAASVVVPSEPGSESDDDGGEGDDFVPRRARARRA
jgi:hypothetical protein